MTEDEAKTKWCPLARIGYGNATGMVSNRANSRGIGETDPKCVGSACMAWRWLQERMGETVTVDEKPEEGEWEETRIIFYDPDGGPEKRAWTRKPPAPTRGYCGAFESYGR